VIKSNKQIGIEIKERRKALGISQMKLASEVGISFQQIQKYEKGVNKISVERIQQIADVLKIPVHTFFEQKETHLPSKSPNQNQLSEDTSTLLNQEEITLLRLFKEIASVEIKEGLINQLRGIAEWEKQK
jgi:transcriptional regulator with XRE-family HTH domain